MGDLGVQEKELWGSFSTGTALLELPWSGKEGMKEQFLAFFLGPSERELEQGIEAEGATV